MQLPLSCSRPWFPQSLFILSHHRKTPGVLDNPLEASHQGCRLPGTLWDHEVKEYDHKSLDPMAESMSLDFATRMHQKRKHNLDSPNESSERETHSRRDVKEDGTFISRALDLSDSQQKAVPANGGHNGKRPRLYEPLSQTSNGKKSSKLVTLPAEIWQHIFCFVPPISLGLVLRVNHAFHDYLDEHRNGEELPAPSNCIVRPMKAQAIWCASRKRFSPELPRSLHDLTEVALWRLLRGSNCQICGKFRITSEPLSTANPWRNGLGNTGPRIIWPFGIRTCASCLTDVTKTVGHPTEYHQMRA